MLFLYTVQVNKDTYFTEIQFLQQSAGRLPVPGYTNTMDNMSKNKPNTSITHVGCESKLRSTVRSSMHPYPGDWVVIGRHSPIVHYARAAITHSVQELNVRTVWTYTE